MSNGRFFSVIALTALVTGAMVAALALPTPAAAAAPRTVECKYIMAIIGNEHPYEEWISEQLALGRTSLIQPREGLLCAW